MIEHHTMIGYRRIVKNILVTRCGDIALRDFDRIAVNALVTTFGESTSAKRINNVLGPLRGARDEVLADNLILSNPLDGFNDAPGQRQCPRESGSLHPAGSSGNPGRIPGARCCAYPYQIRHTFASQALSAGENAMWVAKQMSYTDWTIAAKKHGRWIPSIVPDARSKAAALWVPAMGN